MNLVPNYPEISAGGFSRVDTTIAFYQRVHALLHSCPHHLVVDLGAGRGRQSEDAVPYRRHLRDLRGPGRTVIGLDVDASVFDNPLIDDARLISKHEQWPLDTETVDLVISDFVFEHLTDPAATATEVSRVVRPGGWVCVRTPNRNGYIGLLARAVPNRFHRAVLRRFQPDKPAVDTFDTAYRANSLRALQNLFGSTFEIYPILCDGDESSYAGGNRKLEAVFRLLRCLPEQFRSQLLVFMRKKQPAIPSVPH